MIPKIKSVKPLEDYITAPRTEVIISGKTIGKIIASGLTVYLAIQLWPLALMLVMAILLAITLYPLVGVLSRYGIPRKAALVIITLGLLSIVAIFFGLISPPLIDQISSLPNSFSSIRESILQKIGGSRFGQKIVDGLVKDPKSTDVSALVGNLVTFGQMAMSHLAQVFLVMILAVYFVADGNRTYSWVTDFFSTNTRQKLDHTAEGISGVVFAYIRGQVITSLLAALFCFAFLLILGVPSALALGILAGILDIFPVIGFILALIPAALIGFSVGTTTGLVVMVGYIIYHTFESYILVPRLYGDQLRLSALVVLVSILVGSTLAGVSGALVALPAAASYPIIERIWLVNFLGRKTVEKHTPDDDEES